jgi:glycosyltransferase involved in cell wall biosynthesis
MHRTPVIARNLGSLTEIVTDSGGGVLYRTDDELVRAIEALRSDGSLRDRLGDLGHRAYLERWTRAAHLHEYYRVARETAARVLGRVPWEE